MDDKIIVTHKAALVAKYKSRGLAAIRKALRALVAADKKRGIKTRVIYLDDAKAMKSAKSKPLVNNTDCRATKSAIDAIFKKHQPDYLMILGAPDVLPHQDLLNPAYAAGDDDDKKAWGDIPYACDASYSRDVARFVGPTRIVSRLPDLTGATEPSHLIALIRIAAGWKSRQPKNYVDYFGLSAHEWQGSTALSLDAIFGNATALDLAPPKGPKFPKSRLDALMHFINCHGEESSPAFLGQKGNQYPVSLTTRALQGAVKEGAVASVECCYGGQLYDSVTLGIDIPICQSYLRQGSYAYFGSTTIAYGPVDTNGAADLVCQYFLLHILAGASTGRAALMARQQFVNQAGQMDPVDLKTLAQFCLYGDPSIHPVAAPEAALSAKDVNTESTEKFRRSERRAALAQTGKFLQKNKATASTPQKTHKPAATAKSALAAIAAKSGLPRDQVFVAYKVKGGAQVMGVTKKAVGIPAHYYLSIGRPEGKGNRYRIAVIAKEINGRIIDYRIYQQR
jgi:hypothetical protein